MVRVDAAHGDRRRGSSRRRRPRWRRRSGRRSPGARWAAGWSTPCTVSVELPDAVDLGAHLLQHRAQVDDLGLARGVVDHRACPRRARRPSGCSRWRRRWGSRARSARRAARSASRDHAAVLDLGGRAQLAQAGLVHVQRPGADRVTAGQRHDRAPAPRHQRARARTPTPAASTPSGSRPARPAPPGRRWPPCRASTVDRAAQAAQHVGHQRDVEDLRAVGDRRRALGEQRRRHQLEHAVLRARPRRPRPTSRAPPRTAKCSTTADDASAWHPLVPVRPPSKLYTVAALYRRRMAVHLTRIYTKTGDDGTTALGDFTRVRKTDVRLAAYADTDECNAAIGVAVTVGGAGRRRCSHRCGRCRTTCSTWARTCATPIVRRPEVPAAAGDRGLRHPARGLVRRASTRACRSSTRSSCPAAPPARPTCTWRARSPAAPSGRCGRCWRPTPSAPTR